MTPTSEPLRLAVIDGDSGFVRVLENRLQAAGWRYRAHASTLPPEELVAMRLNALVVDPAYLGSDASAYLDRVCQALPSLAVIVCTGPSSVAQRVRGLRAGLDDWITKPCHPEEVIARVEAATRRHRRAAPAAESGPMVAGELEVRADQFPAFVSGRSVDLTRREFEVLQALVLASGQVIQREELYQRVWGYAMAHGDRSVDVFVRKLRLKIERCSPGWTYIHTHFGIGYRFDPRPESEAAPAGSAAPQGAAPDDAASDAPLTKAWN